MKALLLLRQGSAFLLLQTELRDFLVRQDEGGAAVCSATRKSFPMTVVFPETRVTSATINEGEKLEVNRSREGLSTWITSVGRASANCSVRSTFRQYAGHLKIDMSRDPSKKRTCAQTNSVALRRPSPTRRGQRYAAAWMLYSSL
jgi:hypothetical protein